MQLALALLGHVRHPGDWFDEYGIGADQSIGDACATVCDQNVGQQTVVLVVGRGLIGGRRMGDVLNVLRIGGERTPALATAVV